MNKRSVVNAGLVLALASWCGSGSAFELPQENWVYFDTLRIGSFGAIAIDASGRIHTSSPSGAFLYTAEGVLIRQLAALAGGPIAADPAGNTYLLVDVAGQRVVAKYDLNGNELARSQGRPQVLGINSVAVLRDGVVAVGTGDSIEFLSGSNLSSLGAFPAPLAAIRVTAYERDLAVAGLNSGGVGIFDRQGQIIQALNPPVGIVPFSYANGVFTVDQNCVGAPQLTPDGGSVRAFCLTSGSGEPVGQLFSGNGLGGYQAGVIAPNGRYYALSSAGIDRYARGYRSPLGSLLGTAALPLPTVIEARRRLGTSVLDIDYVVRDADSATVEAWPMAFRQNVRSLSNLVVPATFVGGTASNRGLAVSTGAEKRLSWDVAADLAVAGTFEQLRIEIASNDARAPLEFHWVTVPANVPTNGLPALKVSAQPVKSVEMLGLWFWFVARGDAAVQFTNGEVRGTAGPYAGQLLASGTATTALGKQYLYERLGVRAATQAERDRAIGGSSSGNQSFKPRNRVGTGPVTVNELGIEVGAEGDYVVDL